MSAPRPSLLSLLALLAVLACGGEDGPTEPPPAVLDRIELAPGQAALYALGTTLDFGADGFTSSGAPVTDVAFTWSSSDPSVASIDGGGRATATGFGSTVISATADGVTGQATLFVRDCTEALRLAPGEWVTVPVPQAGECGVVLPSGAAGDRYRVAVVRTAGVTCPPPDPSCGVVGIDEVTLTTTPIGVTGAPLGAPGPGARRAGVPTIPASLRRPTPDVLLESLEVSRRTAEVHHRLRAEERELVSRLRREGRLAAATLAPPSAAPRPQAALPERLTLDNSTSASCFTGDEVVALKIWEDERLGFYQDSVQRQNASLRVSEAHARRMAEFYRDYGEDVIEEYFGGITDIDANGKVIVFFSPMVTDGTAAFVWSGDFFDRSSCSASNEGEYIYFSADVAVAQDEGNWQSLETLVHEMKHVSSLKKSIDRPTSFAEAYHPSWIEEGTAEIAGNVASRRAWQAVGGPAQNVRATGEVMSETGFDASGNIRPEFYGMAIRMIRTQGYLASQPNAVTLDPLGAASGHSVYGSGFHFHRWLGDAYGDAALRPGADADFFTDQNASSIRPGLQGLEALTGKPFSELVTEYAAAVLLNDDRFSVAPPERPFTTIDFASGVELFCFALSPAEWRDVRDQNPGGAPPCGYQTAAQASGPDGTYPWPVTAAGGLGNSVDFGAHVFSGDVGNGGLRIHDFVSTGQGTGIEVQALVVREPDRARLVVARIN